MLLEKLTDFQIKVLKTVLEIPLGQTRSYQWVARKINQPRAWRAVGRALNVNPWLIIIPCHRIIKADGSLGGYAKGLKIKKRLLEQEKEVLKSLGGKNGR